ncbi:MAG TPA: FAD-binding oxidoreductase, partial [Candidatus Saccharimonadales bacterium]|nr:FAD-binding oxidoreductase [Candidatus Saccharimonadales bacterium]
MKVNLKQLQSRLHGHVTAAADALDYFSTDGSIFTITPSAVVYPHSARDVQQTVLFARERAEGGQPIGVVARGKGTDQAGGALGDGIMVVFPAHMNRLRRLDKKTVTVQPGLIYKDLQNTLHSHRRFLPPYPSSIDFCSIGGAVANNACGEKTIKYGATRDFVESLKVVLSDGSLIETRRLSARQLDRKKGQADFEGEVYRQLDGLLTDNAELIARAMPRTSKNAAGYALWRVKGRDGSFDLSQLLVGSQGTLGIVTEATLRTAPHNPRTTLVVGYFDNLDKAGQAVVKLQAL